MQKKHYDLVAEIYERFQKLYPQKADKCQERLEMMMGRYGLEYNSTGRPYEWSEKDVFLITYGNTLVGEGEQPLATLRGFLSRHVKGVINTVHILPFFPYSSDDGFSVIDYRKVNPELGSWNDIKSIAAEFRLMSDLVINHVSRESEWFQDYVHGLMPGRHYFIEVDPAVDLSEVVRPRSLPLLTPLHTRDGLRHLWTTFSDDQMDLDFSNPDVLFDFLDIIMFYILNGVRVIRLDAIAYLWKKIGTSCIHLPETHEVVKLIRNFIELISPETSIITETNVPHDENISYFGKGDEAHMVYQFPLPPLILHAMLTGNCRYLTQWVKDLSAEDIPQGCTFYNFTASHDGIGVRPLEGLVPDDEREKLIEDVRQRGGQVSTRNAAGGDEKPYELNISYFDAVSNPDSKDVEEDINRFLCSQALMLTMQGVPAVYVHSLLGTRNDYDEVERTGRPRSVNRSTLQADGIEGKLKDSSSTPCRVFTRYKRLLHCRTQHPAFHPQGEQKVFDLSSQVFAIERMAPDGKEKILCLYNLSDESTSVELPREWGGARIRDIITGRLQKRTENKISLPPYQPRWLVKS